MSRLLLYRSRLKRYSMSRILLYRSRLKRYSTDYDADDHINAELVYRVKKQNENIPISINVTAQTIRRAIKLNDIEKLRLYAHINSFTLILNIVRHAEIARLKNLLSNFAYSYKYYVFAGQFLNVIFWQIDPVSDEEYDIRFDIFKSCITKYS